MTNGRKRKNVENENDLAPAKLIQIETEPVEFEDSEESLNENLGSFYFQAYFIQFNSFNRNDKNVF